MKIKTLIILIFGATILFSCFKEKTWRDYGDYYSFNEGFLFDGKEYHERIGLFRNGMMFRTFGVRVEDSVMTLIYKSYWLSSKPYGPCDAVLSFSLTIDSCSFDNGKKWEMVSEQQFSKLDNPVGVGSVLFRRDNGIKDSTVCGWLSFTLGSMRYDGYSYRIYLVQDLSFEFELTWPEEGVLRISEGYIRGNPVEDHQVL